jgi:L-fuconolactonase
MQIDSHQHFWKYHPVKDAWITGDMKIIQHDFLPEELLPLLQQHGIDGCIAVQADQSEIETHFLLQLADKYDFIKGVVGWVDLRAENLEERLGYFSAFKKLKGFRHIVQAEPEDDFLLRPDFCKGIEKLVKYGFTYDILIFPRQLSYAASFVKQFPQQAFVIDHLAKPDFRKTDFSAWEKNIRAISVHPNVYCKVSGMVTEADWQHWKPGDFNYCLDVVTETFGTGRLMFGSDWPVCMLAASYNEIYGIVRSYYQSFSAEEQYSIWGGNAAAFYNL